MRKNIGNLISTNGFLSTTRDIDVAYIYAGIGAPGNDGRIPTLFIVNVNIQSQTNILADIGEMSMISDEAEVLFDLGSTFKIDKVFYDKTERFWTVEMTTTDEGEMVTNEYLTSTRNQVLQSTNILTFGQLLLLMGEPYKAQQYYETLLLYSKEFNAPIYHMLGLAYTVTHDFSKAIDNTMRARDLFLNAGPSNMKYAAHATSSIGHVLYHQKQYKQSIEFYQHALKLYAKVHKDENTSDFVDVWSKLGNVYHDMNEEKYALEMYTKALEVQEKLVGSSNDSTIADLYEKISSVYSSTGKYDEAIDFGKKALSIKEQVYPPAHPFIGESYNNLCTIDILRGDHNEAFEYAMKKLKIYQAIYPPYHAFIMMAQQQVVKLNESIELNERKMQLMLRLKELELMKKQ